MDYSKGYKAEFICRRVDPTTWRDAEEIQLISGSIDRSEDELMQSASVKIKSVDYGEYWLRIYMIARQEDEAERTALFTGVACTPSKSITGVTDSQTVNCYSVLKPASDVLLQRGWYAPIYSDGIRLVKSLIPLVNIETDFLEKTLTKSIVAEDGETNLSMAYKILDAIGCRIKIDGSGTVRIIDKESQLTAIFDANENDIIEMDVSVEKDWFDCPNIFRATSGNSVAIARDDDPESPLSTISRNREVWMEELNVEGISESLSEYAIRRLREEQTIAENLKYKRRFAPSVDVVDNVIINYPEFGLDGTYKVTSQKITLGKGCRVSEEAIG